MGEGNEHGWLLYQPGQGQGWKVCLKKMSYREDQEGFRGKAYPVARKKDQR